MKVQPRLELITGCIKILHWGQDLNKLIPAISFTLKNVLPMPSENVTLEQILEFRENNRTERLRFRNLIAEFQIALAVSTTNRELQQNITVFEENIEENVGELEEILEELRITTDQGTLDATILPTVQFLEDAVEGIKNPFTPGRKALERGIEIRQARVNARIAEHQTIRENACGYLYHAQKEGIIDNL